MKLRVTYLSFIEEQSSGELKYHLKLSPRQGRTRRERERERNK